MKRIFLSVAVLVGGVCGANPAQASDLSRLLNPPVHHHSTHYHGGHGHGGHGYGGHGYGGHGYGGHGYGGHGYGGHGHSGYGGYGNGGCKTNKPSLSIQFGYAHPYGHAAVPYRQPVAPYGGYGYGGYGYSGHNGYGW